MGVWCVYSYAWLSKNVAWLHGLTVVCKRDDNWLLVNVILTGDDKQYTEP